jgi:hypothetical protein
MEGGEGSDSNDAERSGKASCVLKITAEPGNVKSANRAIYNLTEGPIILPFKNLTLA